MLVLYLLASTNILFIKQEFTIWSTIVKTNVRNNIWNRLSEFIYIELNKDLTENKSKNIDLKTVLSAKIKTHVPFQNRAFNRLKK